MKLRYTFKTDIVFKMLFVNNKDLLQKLITVLMGISYRSITDFRILNKEILPAHVTEKFCHLDINMRVNGKLVDLEVQVCNKGDYIDRMMFYWAKGFSSAIPSGGSYSDLPQTVVISIMDFSLFAGDDCHSIFQSMEIHRHELLSDKMVFHFFELPKLPGEINEEDDLSLWLSLFNANTEEDLEKIKAMEVPEMEQAVNAYYQVTASKKFQELERIRERAHYDELEALRYAKAEGHEEGLMKGEAKGAFNNMLESIRSIMDSLNLPLDQARTALKIPEIERPRYKEMLQPQ